MNINLGRKGDYSVRVMMDLARNHKKGRRKAKEIAQAMKIPKHYVGQILATLVRSGLIAATAGPDGGYELREAPSKIHLLQVVEAAEGPVSLQRCLLRGIPCGEGGQCVLHETWSQAQAALTNRLRRTTFAQIIRWEAARD